jgi:hypothetical protein
MTRIYDEKMPSYLAMSRGDLIAEILEHGGPVNDHLAAQEPQSMFSDEPEPEVPEAIKRSEEIVRVANDVLRERFGFTINFFYTPE